MRYWRLCAVAGIAICAASGYLLYGVAGGAVGALGAAMIALCIELGIRSARERNARARVVVPTDGCAYPAACSPRELMRYNMLGGMRRRFCRGDAFARQPARNIRSFWCYRTRERTLIFVRLRASRLYCLHLRRAGAGEGARWVVERVEGEEYGSISAPELRLARGK